MHLLPLVKDNMPSRAKSCCWPTQQLNAKPHNQMSSPKLVASLPFNAKMAIKWPIVYVLATYA